MHQLMITREVRHVIALLLAGAALAFAQEYRGRVQGVIVDPSGAVIPGATVVLKNDATNVEVNNVSNGEGRYLFDYVDPGTYTLTADMRGFKKLIQHNILVQQRGDVTVDLKMEMGAVNESITISDSPVALQFNTASRDLTIETKMVRELAVRARAIPSNWRCSIPPSSTAAAPSRRSRTTTAPPTRWTWAAAPSIATTPCSTARR